MSAALERPRKTVEDYLALPDDVRAELIDGELYVTPSPVPDHQRVAFNLAYLLRGHVETAGGGRVWIPPLDVHLPSGDIVQPDVLFIAARNAGIVQDWIRGVPDLLIEVLSPFGGERDRIVKHDLYARNGVPEYWIADPVVCSIEVFRLDAGRYGPAGYYVANADADAVLRSETFPGLELQLAEVFGR